MLAGIMRMRLGLAVAVILAAVGAGPVLAQPDYEDEEAPGFDDPSFDEPDVGPEDEPEAAPEAPQDHGSHHGEGHRFEGGADDDLPTEPAADVDPGPESAPRPESGVPAVPTPSVPAPPPSAGPAAPAAPASPAQL